MKGKPCVAMAEAPPAGAPTVAVKVGPPPTSLVSEDITPGSGAEAAATSTVTVDYIGVPESPHPLSNTTTVSTCGVFGNRSNASMRVTL